MSTLQVANVHLESTGNNRVQYLGSNAVGIYTGGSLVLSANSTLSTFSANVIISSPGSLGVGGANYGSNGQVLKSRGSGVSPEWASALQNSASVATTSGTAIEFTGIPSWAKKITLNLEGVSLSGVAGVIVQIGTSSGFEITGYNSVAVYAIAGANSIGNTSTVGFATEGISGTYTVPATERYGTIQLTNIAGNRWIASGTIGRLGVTPISSSSFGGAKTLAGTLDRVRLNTTNGVDTFDAGNTSILWE